MSQTLSIIIPAFNESGTMLEILNKIKRVSLIDGLRKEIIVIDDGSTDGTVMHVEQFIMENNDQDIRLLKQSRNLGKGAALRRGFGIASGDFILIQDADLEYDPEEYNLLLKPMLSGRADVVYGSRFLGNLPHRMLFYWHSVGNKFLTFLSNVMTNLNLSDMETCYKVFKADIIQNIDLKENGFGFEPEITAKIAKIKGIRIFEIGISYYGRTYEEGKKINWKDGFYAIYAIFKYNLFSK